MVVATFSTAVGLRRLHGWRRTVVLFGDGWAVWLRGAALHPVTRSGCTVVYYLKFFLARRERNGRLLDGGRRVLTETHAGGEIGLWETLGLLTAAG